MTANLAIVGSVTDIHRLMFGPPRHNAHVIAYRGVQYEAEMDALDQRVSTAFDEFIADERERQAQRVAADYNYSTSAIRAAYDRWNSGAFSHPSHRGIQAARKRQLLRALDISIERHTALTIAAE